MLFDFSTLTPFQLKIMRAGFILVTNLCCAGLMWAVAGIIHLMFFTHERDVFTMVIILIGALFGIVIVGPAAMESFEDGKIKAARKRSIVIFYAASTILYAIASTLYLS